MYLPINFDANDTLFATEALTYIRLTSSDDCFSCKFQMLNAICVRSSQALWGHDRNLTAS